MKRSQYSYNLDQAVLPALQAAIEMEMKKNKP